MATFNVRADALGNRLYVTLGGFATYVWLRARQAERMYERTDTTGGRS